MFRKAADSIAAALVSGVARSNISLRDHGFWSNWLAGGNFTGQPVSQRSALQLSTVWSCVLLIAETLATLPINVKRTLPNGTEVDAVDHNLHHLLRSSPNADMTAVDFWTAVLASLLLWGNAYVQIHRSSVTGNITSLEFLLPQHIVRRQRTDGSVDWRYSDPISGRPREILERDMWHTKAFSLDGRVGLSPVSYGANVMGGGIAADKAAAQTFKNGLKSPGFVSVANALKPGQRDEIRKHVREVQAAGEVMVLENSNGFTSTRMNPQDAELLETRKFNVEEICRWFRVAPSMVGHSGGGQTMWGSGVEQQMIAFVMFTLRTWAVRVEQSARKSLLSAAERNHIIIKWGLEGLLRGDSTARANFYSIMQRHGLMSSDEIRSKEDLPPQGGNAAKLLVQSQMVPIDSLGLEGKDAAAVRNALKEFLGLSGAQEGGKQNGHES